MARNNQEGMGYKKTDIFVGKSVALRIDANGIEPQNGFGGFKAIAGQTLSPRLCHTGGHAPQTTTTGTAKSGSATTMQICEVFVPANCTVTGIAVFNGATVAGLIKVGLYDSTGTLLATNATGGAGTTQAGTAVHQRIPFTAPVAIKGPATYFVATVCSGASPMRAHAAGDFGASEIVSVYATAFESTQLSGVTMPSTFSAGVGIIASLY